MAEAGRGWEELLHAGAFYRKRDSADHERVGSPENSIVLGRVDRYGSQKREAFM